MQPKTEVSDYKKIVRSIAGILRATRKQLGLSQVQLAKEMGISQGALSKIESGFLTLDAPQWIHFCQITGVQLNSAVVGYVDFQEPAALRNTAKEHGFRLPQPYSQYRGSKVRALLPLISYFRSVHSENGWEKYLESRDLDPDFFLNLNNQINLQFFLDTIEELRSSGHLKSKDLEILTSVSGKPCAHGTLHSKYDRDKSAAELLPDLLSNASFYECNFSYAIESNSGGSLAFSVTPNPHIEAFKRHPGYGRFLCEYRKGYFRNFAAYGGGSAPEIHERQCIFKGAPKCVFEIALRA